MMLREVGNTELRERGKGLKGEEPSRSIAINTLIYQGERNHGPKGGKLFKRFEKQARG
jgi:hypothetical protein